MERDNFDRKVIDDFGNEWESYNQSPLDRNELKKQLFSYVNGDDSFEYRLIDGEGGADTTTVTINITSVNNPPELNFPTSRITDEDTEILIEGISVTDQDIEEDENNEMEMSLSVENGTLSLDGIDGLTFSSGFGGVGETIIFSGSINNISNAIDSLRFMPLAHYIGLVSLQVAVNDQGGTGSGGELTDSGELEITINAVNDIPTAVDDEGEMVEDGELTGNVLSNDTDLDATNGTSPESHFSLSINTSPITNVSNGTLTLTSEGDYTYIPDPDYFGTDSFVYELIDGEGDVTQGTVNISVNGVNDAPILDIDRKSVV